MSRHLEIEIEKLKQNLLRLAATVEESVHMAVRAVATRDARLARNVIEADHEIDQQEVEIEEQCLKVLALHQPVAVDLRFIVALLKINNDLERIGDLAVNLAERAMAVSTLPTVAVPFDLDGMAGLVKTMLKRSLDSLMHGDLAEAAAVRQSDDQVDKIHRNMYKAIRDGIVAHPEHVDTYILFLSVSRYLERIADHATNIAEDVAYMIEGEIVRHPLRNQATIGSLLR
jgi:phosphate transport system protein